MIIRRSVTVAVVSVLGVAALVFGYGQRSSGPTEAVPVPAPAAVQPSAPPLAPLSTGSLLPPPADGPLYIPTTPTDDPDDWWNPAPQTRALRASAPARWKPGPRARASVATALGDRYGVWDASREAWCKPQSDDDGWICTTIADVEFVRVGGRRRALVTAAGAVVSASGHVSICHICRVTLGFIALELELGDHWRVVSVLDQTGMGAGGGGGDVRVVSLGPAVVGWAFEAEDSFQGYYDKGLTLFAAVGTRVRRVLDAHTGEDNTGSFHPGGEILTTVAQDRQSTRAGFYRLRVTTETSRVRNDRLRRVSTKVVSVDFDAAAGRYPEIDHDSRTIDPPCGQDPPCE